MAARLHKNFLDGNIDVELSAAGTTLSSPGLADVPAISGGDYMPIVLDPDEANGAPEIVYITAHTASATTATITRAQEGTVARIHPNASAWAHAPLAADISLPVTAAGDLLVATGAGTVVPLAIGSAGETLSVVSGTPEWVGGHMRKITSGSFTNEGTGLTISGLGGYERYHVRVYFKHNSDEAGSVTQNISLVLNALTSYDWRLEQMTASTAAREILANTNNSSIHLFDGHNEGEGYYLIDMDIDILDGTGAALVHGTVTSRAKQNTRRYTEFWGNTTGTLTDLTSITITVSTFLTMDDGWYVVFADAA